MCPIALRKNICYKFVCKSQNFDSKRLRKFQEQVREFAERNTESLVSVALIKKTLKTKT